MPTTHPAAFSARRQRLCEAFGGPALIVAGTPRARNYPHNLYPYRAESHFLYFVGRPLSGAALLFADGAATLFVEPVNESVALWTGAGPSLSQLAEELELTVRPLAELRVPTGTATLPAQDPQSAGVQSLWLRRPVEAGSGAQVTGADAALADAVIACRLIHDEAALTQLRWAAALTGEAHVAAMRAGATATRESDVKAALEAVLIRAGVERSFETIVTVGGEVLHAVHSRGRVRPGDLVLCDAGAETEEGWAGDVTRTWPASGVFTTTQRELYQLVLDMQRAAIAKVRPGVSYRDVHLEAGRVLVDGLVALGILKGDPAELLARGVQALFFPHGIGHLLGLDVHDLEDLGDRAGYAADRQRGTTPVDRYLRLDRDLRPGMAVTIEPGFYQIPGILQDERRVAPFADALDRRVLGLYKDVRGIRIEDDLVVTDGEAEVLTRAVPKEVAAVEATLAGA